MNEKQTRVRPLTKRTQHPVPSLFAEGLDLSPEEKAALSVFTWAEGPEKDSLDALRAVYAADIRAVMLKVLDAVEEMVTPYYVESECEASGKAAEGILASLVIMRNEVGRA